MGAGEQEFQCQDPSIGGNTVRPWLRSGSSLSTSEDILSALLLSHSCAEGGPGPRDCIELNPNNTMPVSLFATWTNNDNRAKSH